MTYNCRVSITPTDAWTDPNLSHLQCRLLGLIGSYMGKDQTAWPSQKRLADDLGCSRKAINEGIKALKTRGYIDVKSQTREDGGQTSNLIHVRLDPLLREDHPPVTPELHPLSPPEVTPPVTSKGYTHKKDKEERQKRTLRVREVVDEILTAIPIKKRKMAKAKSIERILPKILKETSPQELIKAVRSAYSQPDQTKDGGQYATAIYTFLNEGMWKSWLSSSPQNQSGALPQASVVPMGQKETIDELLAKRDAERARSAEVGSRQNGDASADLPGVQPQPQEETLEMFERDPRGLEDARLLPSL